MIQWKMIQHNQVVVFILTMTQHKTIWCIDFGDNDK